MYQDRYIAYTKANNKTVVEMEIHDNKIYPGGCMTGFILWVNENLREFKKISPVSFVGESLLDQAGFTKYLFTNSKSN